MRLGLCLLSLAIFTGRTTYGQQPAAPSLKYKMLRLIGGFGGRVAGGATHYIQGRNTRVELSGQPGAQVVWIHNIDLHYHYNLGPAAKVYTATPIDDRGMPTVNPCAPADPAPVRPSGRTVNIHVETVDTGERRNMFGHTARRVLTRQTTTMDPPRGDPQISDETEGWYIDWPAWFALAPARLQTHYIAFGYSHHPDETDVIQVTNEGQVELGLALSLKRDSIYERVIELLEDPLEPALFQPPAGFQRLELQCRAGVVAPQANAETDYPLLTRVHLNWLMLTDWSAQVRLHFPWSAIQ